MTTITWRIGQMDRNATDGGVVVAHWRVTAVDGDYSASAYGSESFTPDASAPDFKPFASLIEADVLGWVWGAVSKSEIESGLRNQIDAQKTPATLNGLPW